MDAEIIPQDAPTGKLLRVLQQRLEHAEASGPATSRDWSKHRGGVVCGGTGLMGARISRGKEQQERSDAVEQSIREEGGYYGVDIKPGHQEQTMKCRYRHVNKGSAARTCR